MQCYQNNIHTITVYVLTLLRIVSCFRTDEADGKLTGKIPITTERAAYFQEGNENTLLRQTQYKRSLTEEDNGDKYTQPATINDNYITDDLMAISAPEKLREKRSKHSKLPPTAGRSNGNSGGVNSKDELMNILGTIHAAKHHRLSRKDIRQLARKAFQHMKMKKKATKKGSSSTATAKKQQKGTQKQNSQSMTSAAATKVTKHEKVNEKSNVDTKIAKENAKGGGKTSSEDEKAFASMFEDSKAKDSEFSEDVTKLEDSAKMNEMVSDDKMSEKSPVGDGGPDIEALGAKKSAAPTESPLVAKTTTRQLEQELNNELNVKDEVESTDLKDKPAAEEEKTKKQQKEISKKNKIPDESRNEKIKTLKTLLAKASKSKVPKKFLGKFPVGLRMIAWRELLGKKKKELAELESMTDSASKESQQPVTIDINIDPAGDKTGSTKKATAPADSKPDDNGPQHISSHVKYLQKHLAGAQDLRKLIARALVGHCKATGKRILKAFIAMDRALTRAQKIATVIGKKFKVDASKIENIVVHKEDQVVESFLRDIFANFN
eukprot:gene18080-19887_t